MSNGITKEEYLMLNEDEKKVADWLLSHKIPFITQAPMFGIGEIGSATIDIILTERHIAIRVMGTHWHSGITPSGRDLIGREKLTEAGWLVVDIWTDNLTPEKVEYTLNRAILGEEIPR